MITYYYYLAAYIVYLLGTDKDILVQSDLDFPSLASAFGWSGEGDDIDGAKQYLDDNEGKIVEDTGYF